MMKHFFTVLLLPAMPLAAQIMRAEAAKPAPAEAIDPEMTDGDRLAMVINRNLAETDMDRSKASLEQLTLIAGDIERVVQLPPEQAKLLRIAAKGAVDTSLESWRAAQETRVREQLAGATLDSIQERLESLGEIHVGGTPPQDTPLWTETLNRVLTEPQRATFKAATEERMAYRAAALSAMLISEMEKKLSLTLPQTERLEPLLKKSFMDYLPDMGNYIDRNSGIDFRLLMLMANGIPGATRREILTDAQQAELQAVTADFSGWWQSILQNHQRRVGNAPQQ
jgi:hypothetical protein